MRLSMKSQKTQNGGLGVNLRLLFHKPTRSLYYTLYGDSKVFSAALCPYNPHFP